MANPAVRKSDGGVIFTVKVVPGSSRTAVCGLLESAIKVKISAPAEKGRANKCLLEFLAKQLGVKKTLVHLVSGATSPVKQLLIEGVSVEQLLERLSLDKQ